MRTLRQLPVPAETVARAARSICFLGLLFPVSGAATEGFGFFREKVEPILVTRCYECHSEESGKQKGGLWLDRRAAWQHGGDAGPVLVPGAVEESLLVHSIRYLDEDLQMPPKGRLPADEIEILEQWITMGAPDPRDGDLTAEMRGEEIDFDAARKSWAFRAHRHPEVPASGRDDWSRGVIDAFILASLKARGLEPAGDSEPHHFLRRLYFDLTGLPPGEDELESFLSELNHLRSGRGQPTLDIAGADAVIERIVDRLLASPSFGEKWGRHWLDVARYSDSNGGDRNFTFHQAWRYRNYVIDSFNRDRSYYDFVRQQVAGDLMTAESVGERRDQLVASGFLALGPKMLTERDKEKLRLDTADEQVDTVGRAFLGLTLGCARCHDHKFDPVSQEDYYALAGIFRSTQVVLGTQNGCVNVASWVEQPLPGPEFDRVRKMIGRLELVMKLVIDRQFKEKAGGKMASNKLPLLGVIYDETDAERVGDWKESTWSENRFGSQYIHNDRKGRGSKKVIFRGSLPKNGKYEVRLAYNAGENRASAVPVEVAGWDGVEKTVLNQRKPPSIGGLFEPIGVYSFEKGGRVQVTIETAETDGYVIVDAVQFIHIGDLEDERMAMAAADLEKGEEGGLKDPFQMSQGELKKELGKALVDLRERDVVMAPRDAADAGDIRLRVRGEVSQLGREVRRSFPRVLYDREPPAIESGSSGRVELAEWLTSRENALLDRVVVNRIWHHLFGRGIVSTVDNFGSVGTEPTHPDLLDHLASTFRSGGGSIKEMIREMVLSRAYRLESKTTPGLLKADPENIWFARQNRRRLTAEEIRDGVLFLSGQLELETGAATSKRYGVDLDKPMNFVRESLRTVYLPVARNNSVPELAVFDVANPDLVSGARAETTVPTQALYLLNSEFFKEPSKRIGESIFSSASETQGRVDQLYRRILNRFPDPAEAIRAAVFVEEMVSSGITPPAAYADLAHVLLVSTEFLYLD